MHGLYLLSCRSPSHNELKHTGRFSPWTTKTGTNCGQCCDPFGWAVMTPTFSSSIKAIALNGWMLSLILFNSFFISFSCFCYQCVSLHFSHFSFVKGIKISPFRLLHVGTYFLHKFLINHYLFWSAQTREFSEWFYLHLFVRIRKLSILDGSHMMLHILDWPQM